LVLDTAFATSQAAAVVSAGFVVGAINLRVAAFFDAGRDFFSGTDFTAALFGAADFFGAALVLVFLSGPLFCEPNGSSLGCGMERGLGFFGAGGLRPAMLWQIGRAIV
jgi:hypothetical protein